MKTEDKKLLFALSIFIVAAVVTIIISSLSENNKPAIFMSGNSSSSSVDLNNSSITFSIDINTATKEQLMEIDGIGEKTAEKIISYRTLNNGYKNMDELLNVEGIGEKTLISLKNYLYVKNPVYNANTENTGKQSSKSTSTRTTEKQSNKTSDSQKYEKQILYPIDINFATYEELTTLKGVGETKANDILVYRSNGYFYTIEDIMKVKGIGESIFNDIKPFIKVDLTRIPPKQDVTSSTTTSSTTTSVTVKNLLNVNTATYEQLMTIPGITKTSVEAIIFHRSQSDCRFNTMEEVEMVLSLSDASQYKKIKQYIIVN